MDKMEMTPCVGIERGKICDKKAGPCYKVESYTRDGVKSRWMESVNKYVNEYQCDSILRTKRNMNTRSATRFIFLCLTTGAA